MKNVKKVGRPTLPENKKKKNRVSCYLSDDDMVNLERLRNSLLNHSPTLSLNDFFILVVNNFDDTLIPYLLESPNSEVKNYMKSNLAYANVFK